MSSSRYINFENWKKIKSNFSFYIDENNEKKIENFYNKFIEYFNENESWNNVNYKLFPNETNYCVGLKIDKDDNEKEKALIFLKRKNPSKDLLFYAFDHILKDMSESGASFENNLLSKEGFYPSKDDFNHSEILPKKIFDLLKERIKLDKNLSEIVAEKLEKSSNLILTGAPGTGKTYSVRKYVAEKLGFNKNQSLDDFLNDNLFDPNDDSKKDKRYCFVQFHAGYDYTDFVEGFKPEIDANDEMSFELKDGIFKAFCDVASKNLNEDYYFVIDEINRADLSRVFGELFFGLEDNYRGVHFKTQHGSDMVIPPNVKLIGTMNDVDRGVESIDFALRRRFTWHEVDARDTMFDIIDNHKFDDNKKNDDNKKKNLTNKMIALNGKIRESLGKEYQIGGAYFVKENGDVVAIWDNHLSSLINEYLRGNKKKEKIIGQLKEAYETAK